MMASPVIEGRVEALQEKVSAMGFGPDGYN